MSAQAKPVPRAEAAEKPAQEFAHRGCRSKLRVKILIDEWALRDIASVA
jgi:hypothetical protein